MTFPDWLHSTGRQWGSMSRLQRLMAWNRWHCQRIIMSPAEVDEHIARYTAELGMTADEVSGRIANGTMPDTFEAQYLEVLVRYR